MEEKSDLVRKIKHAKELIAEGIKKYSKVGVACSFGKDSMVVVHLAREVEPNIPVFSVMTKYKPPETLKYLRRMNKEMGLGIKVYMVADDIPASLQGDDLNIQLLATDKFKNESAKNTKPIFEVDPNLCCDLLKVEPTRAAVSHLNAWLTGLRNTEGQTRKDYKEVENDRSGPGLVKINPILTFTELDVWRYLAINNIPVNPLYGEGYRSLGCAPCSKIVGDDEPERAGRWKDSSKCGGECGIHTRNLRNTSKD
jgi:phosphoadenosine phosphosulfate reductase|tara:strand:+ start:839 stop:1600 length:762 start_codon:yes stop_codon:yes gene_type:complete